MKSEEPPGKPGGFFMPQNNQNQPISTKINQKNSWVNHSTLKLKLNSKYKYK